MSRSPLPLAALAALVLALPGCGESDVLRTERPLVRLTLDEYRIVPQNVSIPPGRIKLVVRNAGRLTHNVVIQDERSNGTFVELPDRRVATMQPGQTAMPIKVDLTPGTYRLVCTIANHDDLGQFGTLEVKR
ncbi:MAG: hypothetical protein QOI48_3146 [Solirubrobacteraceae bacterium]|jgi:hypothetical protein|nr:hypothetical protein [Solirubrobacteraceae bacterium]